MNKKDILTHMKSMSDCIGHALVSEDISARLVRAKQGPMTLTYQVQLVNPNRGQILRAKQLGEVIESISGVGPVRVTSKVGGLIFEFPSPEVMTPHATMLANVSKGSNLAVGFDHWADPVYLPLRHYPNILFVGPARSGKSSAMRSLAFAAMATANRQVELAICAEKVEYWRAFQEVRGYAGLFSDKKSINSFVGGLAEAMADKAKAGERFHPALLVVIDDLVSLLSDNYELAAPLATLVSTGGSVGCYVVIGTQSAGNRAGTGGLAVEDNLVARIAYRPTSRGSAARSTGEGSEGLSELTTQQGDALFVLGADKVRLATGYVSDADVVKYLPKLDHPVRYEQVTHRRSVAAPSNVSLPIVRPARILTEEEVLQVETYVTEMRRRSEKVSKNQVILAVYGNKSGVLASLLNDSLGVKKDQLFPPKVKEEELS